jgi:hypothetical protein
MIQSVVTGFSVHSLGKLLTFNWTIIYCLPALTESLTICCQPTYSLMYRLYLTSANDQLDAKIFIHFIITNMIHKLYQVGNNEEVILWCTANQISNFYTFITILYMYMFRAMSCSSSGGQIVLNIWHRSSTFNSDKSPT